MRHLIENSAWCVPITPECKHHRRYLWSKGSKSIPNLWPIRLKTMSCLGPYKPLKPISNFVYSPLPRTHKGACPRFTSRNMFFSACEPTVMNLSHIRFYTRKKYLKKTVQTFYKRTSLFKTCCVNDCIFLSSATYTSSVQGDLKRFFYSFAFIGNVVSFLSRFLYSATTWQRIKNRKILPHLCIKNSCTNNNDKLADSDIFLVTQRSCHLYPRSFHGIECLLFSPLSLAYLMLIKKW